MGIRNVSNSILSGEGMPMNRRRRRKFREMQVNSRMFRMSWSIHKQTPATDGDDQLNCTSLLLNDFSMYSVVIIVPLPGVHNNYYC